MDYTSRITRIEYEINKWLPEKTNGKWMDDVFPGFWERSIIIPDRSRILDSLTRPGRDLLKRGGKRWLPLLTQLVCESLGGEYAALPLTPLVELCHNASLIHDNIENNSDERRGQPAIHTAYGADTAINSGFLYFLPLACIEAWAADAERKKSVFTIWGEYMRKLHLGQALDIYWHRDPGANPEMADYYTMCALKTGSLARLAAVLGVYAVPSLGQDDREHLSRSYGEAVEKLGIGFQILDDIKNLTTGVPGKKSLPVLLYLRRNPGKRAFVSACFSAIQKREGTYLLEVEKLIKELEKAGVFEEGKVRALSFINAGKKFFDGKDLFDGFVDLLR
jgi:octaprenyl-diphosphate synthase